MCAQSGSHRGLGALLRGRRQALGITLQRVAELAGCTKGYLSLLETDQRGQSPSPELLERLEGALRLEAGSLRRAAEWGRTPEEVKREVEGMRRVAALLRERGVDALYKSGELEGLVARLGGGGASGARARRGDVDLIGGLAVQVPVINRVAAGYPTEFTDKGYPARVADEYVSVPGVSDPDAFAARVVGDSMAPDYREGDIVVFSPLAATAEGSDCFVRLERDAETTFKRVYFERDAARGELIRLQPLNSAYPPRLVEREAVAGLYAAVYVVRSVGCGGPAAG